MSTTEKPSDLIRDFLADQDVADTTKLHENFVLRSYFLWLFKNKFDYNFIQKREIIAYKRYLIETKSILTARTQLSVVKRFYSWAEQKRIFENPATGVRIKHRYVGYRRGILTVLEVQRLLASIDRSNELGLRDFAIVSLLVTRGLRVIELNRANVGDLAEIKGVKVLYVQRKGKLAKDLWVELDDTLFHILESYLQSRGNSSAEDPLFISTSRNNLGQRISTRALSGIVKKYLRGIGLNDIKITAHSLRHTAAATLISQGVDIYSVQLYLGHSSPIMTEVYTRMAEEQKRLENSPVHILSKLFLSHNQKATFKEDSKGSEL